MCTYVLLLFLSLLYHCPKYITRKCFKYELGLHLPCYFIKTYMPPVYLGVVQ
ncbi:unnamed protein product, partial [Vitis vinifera]|uniref:Uncharacterized protein n=1 Tax=Vitis vinifera TaxID=29760 RepID=D7TXK2_VITVI